ncbi:unnamed protein product [Polarella glacialis]|uniref:catechol O-methyltransferase n=1 Tax=Polarella glacialis TaxID=89957 RepID=A0A813IAZ7_POLGL|nr:unnamed protein product [Polarella glacialis]
MARVLGPNARIISFEMDPEVACLALNMIEFAGMSDAIEVWIGQSEDLVCRLARELGPRSVNMVYMDHNQITYHQDFAQLEAMQMLAKDSLLAATQGLKPGAPLLLWRLAEGQKLGRYEFEVVSSPDCGCKQMEDWVVLARFRADNGSQDWSPPEPPREISLLAAECNLMRWRTPKGLVDETRWNAFVQHVRRTMQHFAGVTSDRDAWPDPAIRDKVRNLSYQRLDY